jgi:hypothetical protein
VAPDSRRVVDRVHDAMFQSESSDWGSLRRAIDPARTNRRHEDCAPRALSRTLAIGCRYLWQTSRGDVQPRRETSRHRGPPARLAQARLAVAAATVLPRTRRTLPFSARETSLAVVTFATCDAARFPTSPPSRAPSFWRADRGGGDVATEVPPGSFGRSARQRLRSRMAHAERFAAASKSLTQRRRYDRAQTGGQWTPP